MLSQKSDRPYKCEQCLKIFKCKDNLNLHVLTHIENTGDQICKIWRKTFNTVHKFWQKFTKILINIIIAFSLKCPKLWKTLFMPILQEIILTIARHVWRFLYRGQFFVTIIGQVCWHEYVAPLKYFYVSILFQYGH